MLLAGSTRYFVFLRREKKKKGPSLRFRFRSFFFCCRCPHPARLEKKGCRVNAHPPPNPMDKYPGLETIGRKENLEILLSLSLSLSLALLLSCSLALLLDHHYGLSANKNLRLVHSTSLQPVIITSHWRLPSFSGR